MSKPPTQVWSDDPDPTQAESQKERILRLSTDLFAAKGYHATGVQDLSDAVGLGRGALYWHIKSKEELLFNISIRLINRTVEEARAIALSDMPPIEKLKRLARHLVRSLAENRSGWTVWAQESGALTHERRDQVLAARAGYERIWESALSEAAADGSLYPVDGVQLKGILGMFNSLYLWIHIEGPLPPEEVADKLVSLILDGLRRPLVTTP